jgi:hypothetical protein
METTFAFRNYIQRQLKIHDWIDSSQNYFGDARQIQHVSVRHYRYY